jgi:hypothetical protein
VRRPLVDDVADGDTQGRSQREQGRDVRPIHPASMAVIRVCGAIEPKAMGTAQRDLLE